MKKIIFIIFIVISGALLYGDTLESYFKQANELYIQNDFKGAIDLYEKIANQGFYSKELFYNMSNTYYRLEQIGQALQYIEKAYRLAPRDVDIRFNRRFLFDLTGAREDIWTSIIGFVSINELFKMCIVLYSLIFVLFFINRFYRTRWFYWVRVGIISIGLVFALWLYASYTKFYRYNSGITIVDDANVYSGPSEDQTISFSVPQGKKVVIFEQRNNWFNIGIKQENLKGWIEKDKIGKI